MLRKLLAALCFVLLATSYGYAQKAVFVPGGCGTITYTGSALQLKDLTIGPDGLLCVTGGTGGGGTAYTKTYGGAIGTLGTPGGFADSSGNFQPNLGDTTNGQWVNVKAIPTHGVTQGSGSVSSGAYSAGAFAAGALSAGALASGAGVDGWDATQGSKTDAPCSLPATTTACSMEALAKAVANGVAGAIPAQSNRTTNIGTVDGGVNLTPTDCSGTITTGGTAQNALTAQTGLHGLTIVNIDTTEPLWISFTGTAAAAGTASYPLPAATATTYASPGSFTTPMGFGFNHALSVIAATTSHKFSCTWW